jgi:hypothetical protein
LLSLASSAGCRSSRRWCEELTKLGEIVSEVLRDASITKDSFLICPYTTKVLDARSAEACRVSDKAHV